MSPPALTRLAGAVFFSISLWAVYIGLSFRGFFHDPLWYMEPARNFAWGKGIVTNILYPAQAAQLAAGTGHPAPFLLHGPGSIMALGLCYKIFGVSSWTTIFYSYGLFLAVGLLVYRLAWKVGGETAGLLAAILYWVNAVVIERSLGALTDNLFTLLITAAFFAIFAGQDDGRRALWRAAGAGLLVGLASSTRLAGQSYWVGFLIVAAWSKPRTWRKPAAFLLGLAAALLPLAAYNLSASGKPLYSPGYYLLAWSQSFPGFRSSTSFLPLTSLDVLFQYPKDVAAKLLTGPLYAVNRLLSCSAPYFMACAILALARRWPAAGPLHRLRAMTALLLVPVIAVNIVVSYGDVGYMAPLFPPLAVLASCWLISFYREVEPRRFSRLLGLALFALFFISSAVLQINSQRKDRDYWRQLARDQEQLGRFLEERTRSTETFYSDDPASVAWHGGRFSIMLTASMADAYQLSKRYPADGLILTSARIESPDFDPAWEHAFRNGTPVFGFVACERFNGQKLKAVLYRSPERCGGDREAL